MSDYEVEAPGPVPGASPRPGGVVDLDALRARRLEAAGERRIVFGGREWLLVSEVPFEFAEAWAQRRRRHCVELLLADPGDVDEFMALRPSNDDFDALLETFRTTPGKSSAS